MVRISRLAAAGLALLAFAGAGDAQIRSVDVRAAKGVVVGRESAAGSWLLELDRSVATGSGRVRSVRLGLDERRGPARPIITGDRLSVDGRIIAPALSGDFGLLEPARIEHLDDPGLRHAYFLFRSGRSEGCAECHVPLLLTGEPLTAQGAGSDIEIIVTYECDSIWEIRDQPGRITEVLTAPRTLRLEGRPYRYQEVPLSEAIRLLRNPLGSIPISRPMLPDAPTATRRQALLLRLTR